MVLQATPHHYSFPVLPFNPTPPLTGAFLTRSLTSHSPLDHLPFVTHLLHLNTTATATKVHYKATTWFISPFSVVVMHLSIDIYLTLPSTSPHITPQFPVSSRTGPPNNAPTHLPLVLHPPMPSPHSSSTRLRHVDVSISLVYRPSNPSKVHSCMRHSPPHCPQIPFFIGTGPPMTHQLVATTHQLITATQLRRSNLP